MKIFGYKTIVISKIILIFLIFLFNEQIGIYVVVGLLIVDLIILSKMIKINHEEISVISIYRIFNKKKLWIDSIKKVHVSDGGLTSALTTISFFDSNEEISLKVFMLMYPFERRQLAKYLEDKGIIVDGNGI